METAKTPVAAGNLDAAWGRVDQLGVPGYFAPAKTTPAAAAVADRFLRGGSRPYRRGLRRTRHRGADGTLVAAGSGRLGLGAAATIAELAASMGLVGLELSGHFVGTAEPTDEIYSALLNRQVVSFGLSTSY